MKANEIIELLKLLPHPEGGYYKETYRSDDSISFNILNKGHKGKRNLATSIYYLLESGQVSKFHRLKSDEIWYYHCGSPMRIICLSEGEISSLILGADISLGQLPQAIIKAGTIFGATPFDGNSFTLVGCVVTPGFDFKDFEFVRKEDLRKEYPNSFPAFEKFTYY